MFGEACFIFDQIERICQWINAQNISIVVVPVITYETLLHSSDLRLGLEFDYNYQTSIGRGARPLFDWNGLWNCEAKFHLIVNPKIERSLLIKFQRQHFPLVVSGRQNVCRAPQGCELWDGGWVRASRWNPVPLFILFRVWAPLM